MASLSQQLVAVLAGWEAVRSAATLLLYLPLPGEFDVTGLVGRVEADAVVTRTPAIGGLTVHSYHARRELHRFGFEQPVAGTPEVSPATVDVALVPGLVFDRAGFRLGWGAGYFDLFLPQLRPDALRVGIAAPPLVVERVPHDFHDVAMTHLATPEEIRAATPT